MSNFLSRSLFYVFSLVASLVVAMTAGCASGGYKLTRQYARWVNSQMIILRVIIYIVTIPVYGITLLIDGVIFNTMDFWNGTVAAGAYQFEKDGKTFQVQHQILPGTELKKTLVQSFDSKMALLQTTEITETVDGKIQLKVDGILRTEVTDIRSFPIATVFGSKGQVIQEQSILTSMPLAGEQLLAGR